MKNPYAPNETSSQIYSEKTWLQGALLSDIVYGVELTLFVICFSLLAQQITRHNYKRQIALLAFVSIIFILGSLFMLSLADFTQLSFITNRNYPGGPGAYEEAMFWIPIDEMGNAVFVVGNWLMDALLVWRCMIIHSGSGRGIYPWAVVTFPCLLWLASCIVGTLFLAQTSTSSPFSDIDFTLAYFTISLALNIIVTILIVVRLLLYRRRMTNALGAQHVTHYANIAAILIESASLYSAFSIMFLVPFALKNPLSQVFLQSMGQVQTVASLLIVFRVATGKGWTSGAGTQITTELGVGTFKLRNLSSMRFAADSACSETVNETSKMGIDVIREVVSNEMESSGEV